MHSFEGLNRLFSLDVLRGVAIWLVLFAHYPLHPYLSKAGWMGVDLFFVLSGFLVSGYFFQRWKMDAEFRPGLFLIRRGLRIWPMFYAMLVLFFTSDVIRKINGGFFQHGWEDYLLRGLFLQNYFGQQGDHTWSLAVEEHVYLFLALFLPWCLKDKLRFIRSFFVVIIAIVAMRCWHAYSVTFSTITHHYPTHFRMDGILWGVGLRYATVCYPELIIRALLRYKWLLVVCVGVFLSFPFIFPYSHPFIQGPGFTLLYLGFGFGILWAWNTPDFGKKNRISRILAYSGKISFALFLFHFWILKEVMVPLHQQFNLEPQSLLFPIFVVLSFCLAFLMMKGVEEPGLKFRDRWFPDV